MKMVKRIGNARVWVKGIALLAIALAGLFTSGCERQANYPDRPVILICPWAAGGGTDRVARQLAVGLEGELGVPVNVVNATGASGVTGHTRGALARPDGYTITLATAELNMLHWRGLTPVTWKDFQPGVLVNLDPGALLVRKDAPWKTLADLNRYVLENPGALRAAGTALGGIWHVAMAGWLGAIGAETDAVRWISIEGATPSLQELMAGGLDIVSCSLPEARTLLEAGEVRALGVMADARLEQFPEIPTMREQGVDASLGTWRGIVMPADVPEDRAELLAEALDRVVQGEGFRHFMKSAGFNWTFAGPDEFEAFLADLDYRFGEVLSSEEFQTMGDDIIGPMAFPSLLGALGGVVFVGLLLTGGLARDEAAALVSRGSALRVAEVLGAVVAYVVLAETVGFVLTAFALLVVMMWRMRVRWVVSLPVSLLVVATVYHVFAILLRVPLPRGWFGW